MAAATQFRPITPAGGGLTVDTQLPRSRSRSTLNRSSTPSLQPPSATRSKASISMSEQDAKHKRFVLADPVAFAYLEEDPSTTVLERRSTLEGYQCYLVEQWACSRKHPTFIVVTYTGDSSHSISVGVLSVPAAEESWSPRLKVYFKSLTKNHSRRKDTPLGTLMVTNLSGLPTSLSIVAVPAGDVRKHREDFFVNENLKRLGCAGRVSLTLSEPTGATKAKFYHLYKTSDKIPFYDSVIELVKLCQVALMLFGCLGAEYADGLLCDVTEGAVTTWWATTGNEYSAIEPNDGILGPTTVAALLGLLIGARNRLKSLGAPLGKDVFEVEMTKRGIAWFQKQQGIAKSRRFDRHTLDRLHKVTAKQASSDGWAVSRAVKSTVADLSGKGGEMVMDVIGRDKANIAEIETPDIDKFSSLVKGERARWLWFGTPRKRTTRDMFNEHTTGALRRPPTRDDHVRREEALKGKGEPSNLAEIPGAGNELQSAMFEHVKEHRPSRASENDALDAESVTRKGVFDRAKGRLKGAVGRRGHPPPLPRDYTDVYATNNTNGNKSVETLDTVNTTTHGSFKSLNETQQQDAYAGEIMANMAAQAEEEPAFTRVLTQTPIDYQAHFFATPSPDQQQQLEKQPELGAPFEYNDTPKANIPTIPSMSDLHGEAIIDEATDDEGPEHKVGPLLRRRASYSDFEIRPALRDARFLRHLSFSLAEDTIYDLSDRFIFPKRKHHYPNPMRDLKEALLHAGDAKELRAAIADLDGTVARWAQTKLQTVETLEDTAGQDVDQLYEVLHPRNEEYHTMAREVQELVADTRQALQDSVKDVETLGARLDYEISNLQSKVDDMTDAVDDFEKQVEYTEGRVQELIDNDKKESFFGWLIKSLLGLEKEHGEDDILSEENETEENLRGRKDFKLQRSAS